MASAGSCGTLSIAARTAAAARSSARHSVSVPLRARPIGVRAVETITASGMSGSFGLDDPAGRVAFPVKLLKRRGPDRVVVALIRPAGRPRARAPLTPRGGAVGESLLDRAGAPGLPSGSESGE
jgi:hypothetical protein